MILSSGERADELRRLRRRRSQLSDSDGGVVFVRLVDGELAGAAPVPVAG
ncbi:hypothetical protein ABZW18_21265 [Streptomyces sp. NPDC004647]